MRTSGILLHISSLPSREETGTLGNGAYRFVDFLAKAGVGIWQVLPIGPTGYGESPYQSPSTFAGNPLFIDSAMLERQGILPKGIFVPSKPAGSRIDFDKAKAEKTRILRAAYEASGERLLPRINAFRARCPWVDQYALFSAIKDKYNGVSGMSWPEPVRMRQEDTLALLQDELAGEIGYYRFIQYLFDIQWKKLKDYANKRGILLFGDMPIYVAEDSADTWEHPENFQFDEERRPVSVAGVPPDYFSPDGQLWGNPLYRWDKMKKDGYQWWIDRLSGMMHRFDMIRIDHFIGFANNYSVPAGATHARNGKWVIGPGRAFFRVIKQRLPDLRIIAEDLGEVNQRVKSLLAYCGYPGMKVLQFAFGGSRNPHLPARHRENMVVYTGTHDNDTTIGWYRNQNSEIRKQVKKVTGARDEKDVAWCMIRTAYASKADTAVIPMQDILGLGGDARMNTPGTLGGNWLWRMTRMPGKTVAPAIREALIESGRFQPPSAD